MGFPAPLKAAGLRHLPAINVCPSGFAWGLASPHCPPGPVGWVRGAALEKPAIRNLGTGCWEGVSSLLQDCHPTAIATVPGT